MLRTYKGSVLKGHSSLELISVESLQPHCLSSLATLFSLWWFLCVAFTFITVRRSPSNSRTLFSLLGGTHAFRLPWSTGLTLSSMFQTVWQYLRCRATTLTIVYLIEYFPADAVFYTGLRCSSCL